MNDSTAVRIQRPLGEPGEGCRLGESPVSSTSSDAPLIAAALSRLTGDTPE
jgi:hypothetical protein